MSDLISRQAAIYALERKKDKNANGDIGGFYNTIIQNDIDALMQLPSAQQEHGRWEDCSNGWMCSMCKHDARKDYPYCPNCGAKMDEVAQVE